MADRGGVAAGPSRGPVPEVVSGSLRWSKGTAVGPDETELGSAGQRIGDQSVVGTRPARLRRESGGRKHQVYVRLSDDEHAGLQSRADVAGVSLQRYLVEAGLSGSATGAADRRRVEWDLGQARTVLKAAGNNLNQLAKWANANHVLPDHMETVVGEVHRAVEVVEDSARAVARDFERER